MLALVALPYAVRMAIDHGLQGARSLAVWCAVVLAVNLLAALLGILRHRTMTWVRADAAFRTIRLVSEHSMLLGRRPGSSVGEVAAIGMTDSWAIGRCLTATGPGIGSAVAYVVTGVLLWQVSPMLTLVIVLGAPTLALLIGPALRALTRAQRPYREQQARFTDQSFDLVGGLRVLNALGGKELFAARLRASSQQVRAHGYRVGAAASAIEARPT